MVDTGDVSRECFSVPREEKDFRDGQALAVVDVELAAAWSVVAMDPVGGVMALPVAALACAERLYERWAVAIEALAVSGQVVQGNRMGLAGEIVAAQAGNGARHGQIDPTRVLHGPLAVPAAGDLRLIEGVWAFELLAGLSADIRPTLVVRAAAANARVLTIAWNSERVAGTRCCPHMLK